MNFRQKIKHIGWLPVFCWLFLAVFGWMNIFSSVYTDEMTSIFSLSVKSGNQFLWIMMGMAAAFLILFIIPPRIYTSLAWVFYVLVIILLVLVLVVGKEVNGARSWMILGPVSMQPSELSKLATSLLLSTIMGSYGFRLSDWSSFFKALAVVLLPVALIALEPDMGTILVYCSLTFVFYREGMSGWIIMFVLLCVLLFIVTLKYSACSALLILTAIMGVVHSLESRRFIGTLWPYVIFVVLFSFFPRLYGSGLLPFLALMAQEYWILLVSVIFMALMSRIRRKDRQGKMPRYLILSFICSAALIFSVQYIFDEVLQQHHRDRIENLLGISQDLKGAGYNVHQSEIAIGSGGLFGKGYLDGTQTKFNFVPEQSTDFIFCTIGEEWGLVGTLAVLTAFLLIIISVIKTAEKQRDAVFRIYGYCIASVFFMHVFVNVGMTIGIMPVVGIPLPFMSYGGSSFLSFTVLLFIFLRMDLERWA